MEIGPGQTCQLRNPRVGLALPTLFLHLDSSDLSGPSLSKSSPDASPVTQGLGLSQLVIEVPDGPLKGFLSRFCQIGWEEGAIPSWTQNLTQEPGLVGSRGSERLFC